MPRLATMGAASARALGFLRTAIASAVDQYFNLTTLLLPGNGTNGAQNNTFRDSSINNFSLTRNPSTGPNAPTQGTFSPFSQTGWSNFFVSSSSSNLSAVTGADTSPGTGDFCAELWYYTTTTGAQAGLFGNLESNTDTQWGILLIQTANLVRFQGWNTTFVSGTEPAKNAWNHVAVCRSGSTMSMFINGTRAGTATVTNNFSATTNIRVGGPNGVANFDGYISNARFVKGSSVYDPSQTSITVPTSPLTNITNTKFLTSQSNRFVDNSTANSGSGYTITPSGTPSVQAFSPFAPTAAYDAATVGGSGYFDGTDDYLRNSSLSPALSLGSSDFCIEAWGYWTSFNEGLYGSPLISFGASPGQLMIRANKTSGASTSVNYYINNNGIFIPSAGFSSGVSGGTIYLNTWNHIALTRQGSTFRLFVNGALVNTQTDSTSYGAAYTNVNIGSDTDPNAGRLTGYMTGARVVTGSPVYTAAFTPPTAPPTAISGTYLLANFTNAGITDATAKNAFETVGNAQISTTQSKFGGSSMYFDGTGDYLRTPYSKQWALGGDFTIEFWINYSAHGNYGGIVSCANSNTSNAPTAGWAVVFYATTNNLYFETQGGFSIQSSSSISTNTWTHCAVVRSGSTITMYIGGTSVGSGTSSAVFDSGSDPLLVGVERGFSGTIAGYIDDLRISRYARYTSAFTPPTAAFPLQ